MIEVYLIDSDAQETTYYGDPIEPVTLAEAKKQCNITFDDDDTYLTDLISMCRQQVEAFCHISIVRKLATAQFKAHNRIRLMFGSSENFDYGWAELPFGPVVGEVSVTNVTSAQSGISVSCENDYMIDGFQFKKLGIMPGQYLVTYEVGYQSNLPRNLKLAILNEIAFRYENRGDSTNRYAHQEIGICEAAQALANTYVRVTL